VKKYKFFIAINFCLNIFCSFYSSAEEYVIGRLFGQLGNQMFQIAAATSLAIDHGALPTFPDLDINNEYNIPLNIPLNRRNVFQKMNSFKPRYSSITYKEPCFEFKKIPYKANMILEGYFQSEKYFEKHKETILKIFEPSFEILSYLQNKYFSVIDHPKTVAIHIRTYKDTTPDRHPFVGWEYIYQATQLFDNDFLFVVFSDDINLCKIEIKKILKNKNVIYIEGNRHFHDLYLISLCKHQIMSNSSFSWWGAYLNKNSQKKVICPAADKWFGPSLKHNNPKDVIPKGAIIID
jgi:hypothetical protein